MCPCRLEPGALGAFQQVMTRQPTGRSVRNQLALEQRNSPLSFASLRVLCRLEIVGRCINCTYVAQEEMMQGLGYECTPVSVCVCFFVRIDRACDRQLLTGTRICTRVPNSASTLPTTVSQSQATTSRSALKPVCVSNEPVLNVLKTLAFW